MTAPQNQEKLIQCLLFSFFCLACWGPIQKIVGGLAEPLNRDVIARKMEATAGIFASLFLQ